MSMTGKGRRIHCVMRIASLFRRAMSAGVLVLVTLGVDAGEVPSAPMLRIETGHHTSFIQSLAYDESRQRLITVSDDKTIRVWQLPALEAVAIYRVPIAPGYEGQLYTAALSPDGRTLAVAGWTGWQWDNKGAIYLIDVESGAITGRITGFDEVVGPLAYSPAGHVRLYDQDSRLIGRAQAGLAGARPYGARRSPDGTRIAIGFHDVAAISVLAAQDLSPLYSVRGEGLEHQGNLTTVAWSADGQALYAGGDGGAGPSPIYRIGDQGRGRVERIAAAEARVSQIGVLPNGDVVYVAEDPASAVLDPHSGRRRAYVGPEIADFRDGQRHFRVAHDGAVVQFGYGRDTGRLGRYSLFDRELRSETRDDVALSPPLLKTQDVVVTYGEDGEHPSINDTVLQLDDYERLRSHAIAPDHRHVLLGTEWALRLYDRSGIERWHVKLPATAGAVNASGDGRGALAALSDGTVRWYRMSDGGEVLSLFVHRNETDWIAWIPSGYYMSSSYGDNYIGWHINRGKETSPDFYRAVQFERVLYRPDLVTAVFGRSDRSTTRALPPFDVSQLTSIAPPRIHIESTKLDADQRGGAVLNIRFSAERNSLPMKDYAIYVN